MAAETFDFEQALKELEKRVNHLEGGELSLDESLKVFEEGVKLSKQCESHLKDAESKIEVLTKADDDGVQTKPFSQE